MAASPPPDPSLDASALDADVLLLDAGNTLVFLDPAAAADTLGRTGLVVSSRALEAAMGAAHRSYADRLTSGSSHEDGWRTFMATWLDAARVPAQAVPEAVAALRREHDRFNLWRHLPPDVRPALERAQAAGLRLGIISNSEGQLLALLDRLELRDDFEVILDSGVEGIRKPDPALFHRATDRLGVAPERCLYAGDIPEVDVQGAWRAGLKAALVDALGLHPTYDAAPRFESTAALVDAVIAARKRDERAGPRPQGRA